MLQHTSLCRSLRLRVYQSAVSTESLYVNILSTDTCTSALQSLSTFTRGCKVAWLASHRCLSLTEHAWLGLLVLLYIEQKAQILSDKFLLTLDSECCGELEEVPGDPSRQKVDLASGSCTTSRYSVF